MKNRIKELIKKSKYTQKEVAEKLNIREASLTGWIKGTSIPRLDNAYKLAQLLECKIDDLIDKEKPPEKDKDDEEILEIIRSLDKKEKKLIKVLAKEIKILYTNDCCENNKQFKPRD